MIFYTFLIVRKSCEKTKTTIDLILCATELHCCIKTIKTHRCTMAELKQTVRCNRTQFSNHKSSDVQALLLSENGLSRTKQAQRARSEEQYINRAITRGNTANLKKQDLNVQRALLLMKDIQIRIYLYVKSKCYFFYFCICYCN